MEYKNIGEQCKKQLQKKIKKADALKLVNVGLKNGKPSYFDATNLAIEVGNICGQVLETIDFSTIPSNELEQFARDVVAEVYRYGQEFMNDICKQIQQGMNDVANIGVKALNVQVDKSRIENIIKRYAEAETIKDVEFLTGADVATNIMRSVVDQNIEENAKFHHNAGLHNKVVRHVGFGGCCEWCESKAGTFDYEDMPDDFFAVHKDCNCWIEYRVGRTKSVVKFETDSSGKLIKQTQNF